MRITYRFIAKNYYPLKGNNPDIEVLISIWMESFFNSRRSSLWTKKIISFERTPHTAFRLKF